MGNSPIVGQPQRFPPLSVSGVPVQPNWFSYGGEFGAITVDGQGNFDVQRTPSIFKNLSAIVITASAALWTPATGRRFRFMGGLVSVGVAAGNVSIQDGIGGATIFTLPKAPLDTPFFIQFSGNGILSATAGNALAAIGASTATISGTLWGTEE